MQISVKLLLSRLVIMSASLFQSKDVQFQIVLGLTLMVSMRLLVIDVAQQVTFELAKNTPDRNPPTTPDTQNCRATRLKYARESALGPTSNLHQKTRHPTRQRSRIEQPSLRCEAVQQSHVSGLRFACSPGSTRWSARVAHTRESRASVQA